MLRSKIIGKRCFLIMKKTDNPNSWVFERGIGITIGDVYNLKGNKRWKIVRIVFSLLLLVGYFLLSNYYGNALKSGIIIIGIEISILLFIWMKGIIKKYWPVFIVPFLALIIVIIVVNVYAEGDVLLQQSDILTFSGSYLSFLGTFCLGYFIYIQDRSKVIEEKRTKIRMLISLIEKTNIELLYLYHLLKEDKSIQNGDNCDDIEPIPYNPDWILYYNEYEIVKGANIDLKRTIESFFNNVVNVNNAIKKGKIERAVEINKKYLDDECYKTSKYNEWEMVTCLQAACSDACIIDSRSWIERKETVDLINRLCKKYYFIIENYVYAWLIRHNINTTVPAYEVEREIVDWLLSNSSEIKEIIKYPTDKRIISKVVFDCSLKFNSKSKKVNLVWGEYSLK